MTLITGNRGFIGSKLRSMFGKDGVRCMDIRSGGNLITGKLPEGVDIIYHLAAQTSVESSWYDPVHDADNLRMTVRLVHEYPNAKLIFAQSCASADPSSSPYAFSKWASGEYIKRFHKNYVICTFPNVFGGGEGVADLFKGKEEVTVFGGGEQVRDFVHVDDIVDGLLLASKWPVGEYSMGSGKGTRIHDLAQGKRIKYGEPRQEIKESIVPNTTPHGAWKPKIDVLKYIQEAQMTASLNDILHCVKCNKDTTHSVISGNKDDKWVVKVCQECKSLSSTGVLLPHKQ